MTLYKYRSIKGFKNFIDIIVNCRLYAAPYFDMNDPMEGQYLYSRDDQPNTVIKALKGEKEKIRICSLSRRPDNSLMWAHYADGHRGVVIAVNVTTDKYDVRPIRYGSILHYTDVFLYGTPETAKRILSHKNEAWDYEQEERIFVTDGAKFAEVQIEKIILGSRMSVQDKNLIKKLVSKVAPDILLENSSIKNIVEQGN